jgi:hypothetical protein
MDERAGGHHLGVQQRVARQQAVKVAAVVVRPVHHRGNREAPRRHYVPKLLIFFSIHLTAILPRMHIHGHLRQA